MLKQRYVRRLVVPCLVLILAGTLTAGFCGAILIRRTHFRLAAQSLHDQAVVLCELSRRSLPDLGPADVQQFAAEWGKRLNCRVTIIDAAGQVLGDSMYDPALMDNHLLRPELVRAAAEGSGMCVRHSTTLHTEVMYLAVTLEDGGRRIGFLRLSLPLSSIDKEVVAAYRRLAGGSLVAFGLAGLICLVLARRAARPVRELIESVDGLCAGDFSRPIRSGTDDEFGVLGAGLNRLARSMGRLIDQLAAERQELRTIVDGMIEAVIAVDRNGLVRYANSAAGRMFQFHHAAAAGRRVSEFVSDEEVLALIERVQRDRQPAAMRSNKRAEALDLQVLVYPASPDAGSGAVVLAHDVAESGRYQELRSEFVANVSHELRTPLTIITGFLETLRQGAIEDPVKRDEFLARIERNADQLTNLVDDLLALSELEGRIVERVASPTDVIQILERLCEFFQPVAERKHQRLTFEAPESVLEISGRASDLERAFSNLIDNAIKYTGDGGWITVSAVREHGDAVVSVTDTGSGIPAEDLPRVFERFYRVDKSRSRNMGGTGLGLAITKHVIEAHGGRIEVTSKPGQGSRFTVIIPCEWPAA